MNYRHFKKIAFLTLAGAVFLAINGCTTVRLATIDYSDFNTPAEKTYVDNSISEDEYKKVNALFDEAKNRIEETFGTVSVAPVLIITGTDENSSKYGLGPFPGKAYIAPWEIYLVMNINKIDSADLIAHELMHAQVAEIVGYWTFNTRLPTWLSEGIAMQVDHREKYIIDHNSFDPLEIERIKGVESNSEFWTDSKEGDVKNYRAAKAAVYRILADDEKSLYKKLELLRDGASVYEAFNSIEKIN